MKTAWCKVAVAAAVLWTVVAGGWSATCQAQNSALMDQHAARKRMARDMILNELRAKGMLPANGVVEFSAKTSPDPANPGQLRIQIESIRIVPLPGHGESRQEDAPASAGQTGQAGQAGQAGLAGRLVAPGELGRSVEYMELDIPVQQEQERVLRHSFRMESGVLQDDLSSAPPVVLPPAVVPPVVMPPGETPAAPPAQSSSSSDAAGAPTPPLPAITLQPGGEPPSGDSPSDDASRNVTEEPWYKRIQ